jgi:glycosyltransferase involved in cell wall biosynthesis
MTFKPRLLILSGVYPFPRNAGQQQRVYYTLRALRAHFHLTFLTIAEAGQLDVVRQKLLETCDDAIVLPSLYTANFASRLYHKVAGTFYAAFTGLKFSNYVTGEVEFSPARLRAVLRDAAFDGVLFEYWHAHKSARLLRKRGIATILDMHDVLWQSFSRQLSLRSYLPAWLRRWSARRYQVREEAAWNDFDILIAINQDEYDYARQQTRADTKMVCVPMGTDVTAWPYSWEPVSPRRVAYYGSLGSRHNQQDALLCYREIMPVIWERHPNIEFWIVGSDPPAFIKDLEHDPRVRITGFVERPQEILKTMSLVLCPWSGRYGFRSRVVEVMALGVPVVASADAVHGMGFEMGKGILIGKSVPDLTSYALQLLSNEDELASHSRLARRQMEEKFSYESTYVGFSAVLKEYFSSQSSASTPS